MKAVLRSRARAMRKVPTEAEQRLWGALRNRRLAELKFRRQVPIEGYIVDFACFGSRLIVEVDGSQHAESERDERRDAVLHGAGFLMLRFWNDDIMYNLDAVCEAIVRAATERRPTA